MKNLSKQFLWHFLYKCLNILYPLITFPYIARKFTPEIVGKISFSQSYVQYFLIVALFGLSLYGIRELAPFRNDKLLLKEKFEILFTFNIINTIILSFLMIVSTQFPILFEYRLLILISGSLLLTTLFSVDWFFISQEEYKYIFIRSFIVKILTLIAVFLTVKDVDDYILYAAILSIGNITLAIINQFGIYKVLGKIKLNFTRFFHKYREMFNFFVISSSTVIYLNVDKTMIGLLSSDSEVGLYTVANKLIRVLIALLITIGTILFPRLSKLASENRFREFYQLVNSSIQITFLASIPIMFGLQVLAKESIYILSGSQYLNATDTLKVLSFLILLVSLTNLIGTQLFLPLNKERITLKAMLIGAVINIILNFLLIQKFNSLGAAIASVISEFSIFLILLLHIKEKKMVFGSILNIIKIIISGIIMCLTVKIIIYDALDNLVLNIILSSSIGAFSYLVYLIMFREQNVMRYISILIRKLKIGK